MIAELQAHAQELGQPTDTDKDTRPSRIVANTLNDLQNHPQFMNYPRYRERELPITSSVMESTMKELNYQVKGTEQFWSQPGVDALLQLRSDHLSDSQPLKTSWTTRQQSPRPPPPILPHPRLTRNSQTRFRTLWPMRRCLRGLRRDRTLWSKFVRHVIQRALNCRAG